MPAFSNNSVDESLRALAIFRSSWAGTDANVNNKECCKVEMLSYENIKSAHEEHGNSVRVEATVGAAALLCRHPTATRQNIQREYLYRIVPDSVLVCAPTERITLRQQ